MKPTEAEIAWCLENRDLVARWLEEHGLLGEGDWAYDPKLGVPILFDAGAQAYPEDVWLPGVGDVLEMLERKGTGKVYIAKTEFMVPEETLAYAACTLGPGDNHYGPTRPIALMELLKSVEGENE